MRSERKSLFLKEWVSLFVKFAYVSVVLRSRRESEKSRTRSNYETGIFPAFCAGLNYCYPLCSTHLGQLQNSPALTITKKGQQKRTGGKEVTRTAFLMFMSKSSPVNLKHVSSKTGFLSQCHNCSVSKCAAKPQSVVQADG